MAGLASICSVRACFTPPDGQTAIRARPRITKSAGEPVNLTLSAAENLTPGISLVLGCCAPGATPSPWRLPFAAGGALDRKREADATQALPGTGHLQERLVPKARNQP